MRKVHTAIISKAMIDMGNAQTIEELSQNIRDAARLVHPEAEWLWVEEISPATVILCVEVGGEGWEMTYWRHSWSLSNGMPVVATGPVEMRRVSTFEVKPPTV